MGIIGGGGDEGGDKWGRGWRATRSGAQRGEASGDDLKRAPVAPARGRRSGCMARLLTMRGGRPLLDPASSRADRSSLPHWCPTSPWPPTGCALPSSSGRCTLALTTRVSAARHSLVPASLLPFPDFSQYSGIHGTRRQTSPTPSTDRSLWRPPVLAAAAALSPSWDRHH